MSRRLGLGLGLALAMAPTATPAQTDAAPARRAEGDCRLAIVLALDLSPSVDAVERQLQFNGVAAALKDPEVRDALLSPPGSSVAAAAFVWSGAAEQEIVAPWAALADAAAIDAFAARIAAAKSRMRSSATAPGPALGFAAALHRGNPIRCQRRIVDIAGDGSANDGDAPAQLRRAGRLDGLEINGLVIGGATPDPLVYYQHFVIQGAAAFALGVASYGDYRDGMRRKLLRELRPDYADASP